MPELVRCPWAASHPLLTTYHDEEWSVPQFNSRALWEMLMLEGFQAGLSWLVVLRKREAFRSAFQNFVPEEVARFAESDIARLVADPGIVRSRAKIEATVIGARAYLAMQQGGEDFASFSWTSVGGRSLQNQDSRATKTALSEELSKQLKKRGFKFVGPVIVYAWMQAVGLVNGHTPECFRHNAVQELEGGPASLART